MIAINKDCIDTHQLAVLYILSIDTDSFDKCTGSNRLLGCFFFFTNVLCYAMCEKVD